MGRKAISHLMFYLGVLFSGSLFAAALWSRYAAFVSPNEGDFWAVWAMSTPLILVANAGMLVWWLIRRRWIVALIPVAAIVVNMGYIASMIQLRGSAEQATSDLRIATLNANGFRFAGSAQLSTALIGRLTTQEHLDVVCLQEYSERREFSADSIASMFAKRKLLYFVREGSQALASRFPILYCAYANFPGTNNNYLRADLLVGCDTIRIISVHLQTTGITTLRHRLSKEPDQEFEVESLYHAIDQNNRTRARQAEYIRRLIDKSPYPVVLVGDFNDTPSSYTYQHIKGDLTDGFRACGSGWGGTFRYLGGVLRIDYILYDGDAFEGVRYYLPDAEISDHKAVVATLRLKR